MGHQTGAQAAYSHAEAPPPQETPPLKSPKTLQDLFTHNLEDVYNAEKQLLKARPKMAKGATSEKLRTAIEEHRQETEGQVERLEQIFEILELAPRGIKCQVMEGLIEEGQEALEDDFAPTVKDATIIAAANKVEQYVIAAHGTLISLARLLNQDNVARLLHATLEEEEMADSKLTELAESEINVEALAAWLEGPVRDDG